ncbi:hypothetical protein M8J75_014805 [Diaphorina citri]|nr:hypothetical protein M8J75_014805 [Diaphorina citri]KAI5753118.1 hypothetical protein M8J77_023661 [Diaphorina citri]
MSQQNTEVKKITEQKSPPLNSEAFEKIFDVLAKGSNDALTLDVFNAAIDELSVKMGNLENTDEAKKLKAEELMNQMITTVRNDFTQNEQAVDKDSLASTLVELRDSLEIRATGEGVSNDQINAFIHAINDYMEERKKTISNKTK